MSLEAFRPAPAAGDPPARDAFSNRFLLVAVASRRVVQINGGSRIRVEPGIHKPVVLAVAEVLAGFVSYTVAP